MNPACGMFFKTCAQRTATLHGPAAFQSFYHVRTRTRFGRPHLSPLVSFFSTGKKLKEESVTNPDLNAVYYY
jgi:hypothetical protein